MTGTTVMTSLRLMAQTVAVPYEQDRGLRGVGERVSGKAAVRIQHPKLSDQESRANMKDGRSWTSDSRMAFLETGKPIRHEDRLKRRTARN